MANARNYEEYRRQVLDELGIEYVTEDITDFRRWRLKVLQGLADLITKGDMSEHVAKWLDEHPDITTTIQDGEVTTAKIANEAINSDKLADGSVTFAKLANGVVKSVTPDYTSGKLKVQFSNGTEVEFEVVDKTARTRLDANDTAITAISSRIDKLSTYVTPEMFGAVGDGVTDDTEAMEEAFTHDQVLLINTYKITEAITTNVKNIFGSGTVISANGFVVCNYKANIEGISIQNTSGNAITLKGGGIIDNATISGGLVGIVIQNTDITVPTEIINCTIHDMVGIGAAGIDSQEADQLIIENCLIYNIYSDGDIDADGIRVWQSKVANKQPIVINNCRIYSCKGRFIKGNTSNISITNCLLTNASDYESTTNFHGIDIQDGSCYIAYNTIIGKQAVNVSLRGTLEQKIVMDSNYIESNVASMVAINFTKYGDGVLECIISNNTINVVNNYRALDIQGGTAEKRYIMRDNISNTNNYWMILNNWDEDNRLEVTGLKRTSTNQPIAARNQVTGAFNLYSDGISGEFWMKDGVSVALADLKPNTTLWGKISDISDITIDLMIKCEQRISAAHKLITVSNKFYYRVYNSAGEKLIGN